MGIFSRFRDIVGSNVNSMLDRAEDPAKLIRLIIREMEDTLIELKTACAGLVAQRKTVERQLQRREKKAGYWQDQAGLAVKKGRDDLARQALLEKRRQGRRAEALTAELAAHEGLLEQYQGDIRQLEEKLKTAREKERLLIQRHIHAVGKKRAQEKSRRLDSSETIYHLEDLEQRIERIEAGAEPENFSSRPALREELEELCLDEEIESELNALKAAEVDVMEKRVEALESILDETDRKETSYVPA